MNNKNPRRRRSAERTLCALAIALHVASVLADEAAEACVTGDGQAANGPYCPQMEQVTILGKAIDARDVAGGASVVTAEDLEAFGVTDVERAIRRVPGVSLQVEDGFGLRPNISIRGTATERSSRVTLLEDGVLIAPAPYSAPSAYYFPTFGRIASVEVLKGPSSITQGPYTVGGAINLLATPIPDATGGHLLGEFGSHDTWRVHGWYGGASDQAGFLVETHQWQSDGFQSVDRSNTDTGLDKEDYRARLRWQSDATSDTQHRLDLTLQTSQETSMQSYLGLTDSDFAQAPLRRYGASVNDRMDNEHDQVTASWTMELNTGFTSQVTAYRNTFERAWYKTEGVDFDGSDNAQDFQRTSWSNVIDAVNRGNALGGLTPEQLQALLDGADTAEGAIQLRNNARSYESRGIQLTLAWAMETGRAQHEFKAGLRLHEDEEDRLQRNDSYQQWGGQLLLSDRGLQGNAGNRIQDADALALYLHDRISWDAWTLAPGLRYESIDLGRVDYDTGSDDPASRDPDNLKSTRSNSVDVWIPGLGLLYDFNDQLRLVGGIHKGFSTPGNKPGVDPEESINYELGLRFESNGLSLDAMAFFNDYDNLVGVCTNSSGSDCEPGDSFNGSGVHIPGLELRLVQEWTMGPGWSVPLQLTYTWMDAKFQSDFDSDFFGVVRKGDPVPYIPEHQAWLSLGLVRDAFAAYLSANHVDGVCTQASCDAFEQTDSATLFDLALHYRINAQWELFGVVENLADDAHIVAREPYGARSNKPRSVNVGVRLGF